MLRLQAFKQAVVSARGQARVPTGQGSGGYLKSAGPISSVRIAALVVSILASGGSGISANRRPKGPLTRALVVELSVLYSNLNEMTLRLQRVREAAQQERRPVRGGTHRRQVQRRLSPDEARMLADTYVGGAAIQQLAAQYGVHRHTVKDLLVRQHVPLRARGLTDAQVGGGAGLYRDGWSLVRLGDRYSVDDMTVWRALREAGVVMRRPWQRSGRET
jgi:hypothetical protein